MRFTVSSRGRPIGVTDLGFVHLGGPNRSGWFHPNAEGERLMPVIASVLPAMRAYTTRDVTGAEGAAIIQSHLIGSTLFADLAEALHHVGSLDLTLHREDGSLVPTDFIGIQDTEQLLALAHPDDAQGEAHGLFDEALDEHPGSALELGSDADARCSDDACDQVEPLTSDDEPTVFPRYQIHVRLAEGVMLP